MTTSAQQMTTSAHQMTTSSQLMTASVHQMTTLAQLMTPEQLMTTSAQQMTNLVMVLRALFLLFYNFINSMAYLSGRYELSSPKTSKAA